MESVQSVDACLGIVTCIIRICDFAIRFRNAGEAASEIKTLVQKTQSVLEKIKDAIESRKLFDSKSSVCASREGTISTVLRSIESCHATLNSLIIQVFGESVADVDALTLSKLQLAKIAFNPSRTAGLKLSLLYEFSLLDLALRALDIVDVSSLRNAVDRNFLDQQYRHEEHMQKLDELGETLHEVRNQQMGYTGRSRRPSTSSDTIDSAIGGLTDQHEYDQARNSMQNLSELVRDVGEAYERLTSDNEATDGSTHANAGNERLELQRRVSYSPDLCKDLIDQFKADAMKEQADERWKPAWKSTCRVVELSYETERAHNVPFADILDVYYMLVDILIHLHWWNEAFDCIDNLKRRFGIRADTQHPDLRPETATIHYLQALVYFDRQQESVDTKESDMKSANEDARQAFAIFNHESAPDHSQSEFFTEIDRTCMELHATILREMGEPVEANAILNIMKQKFPGALTDATVYQEADRNLDWRDERSRTELMRHVIEGNGEKVSRFLPGCSTEYINSYDKKGLTALHYASQKGHAQIATELLHYGATVDKQSTQSNETPLFFAVMKEYKDIVHALLARANPCSASERISDGGTVLHMVHRHKTAQVTSVLVSQVDSASFVNAKDRFNRTALHVCSENGAVEQAKVLIEHAANVNAKTKSGKTALGLALDNPPSESMVNLLLDQEVELDRSNLSPKATRLLEEYESRRRSRLLSSCGSV